MTGRLLIVDDDRVFRVTTAALLEAEGHDVAQAADAQEAVDALARDRFDLVLLDLRMPGLDGISLVEVLRTRGEGVPILMISGFGTVDAAVEALHTGADDFLTKPVEPD
nr:response regulator [Actinomycetota bacterium]NIU67528.1 response regulator [Actinomycetota bacterium]NIV87948.1 response regulator [Actinomycetota bacterium]NIW29282.1 response regulator [Actinomycetota bacterium]